MFRRFAFGLGALLGAFHIWLLGNQAWSGQLAEPDVVLRWLAAAALVGGLVSLGRRGVPLALSRQAVAIWVLAALLHGPALANDLDGFVTPSMPEAVSTLVQIVASVSALGLALLALARRGPRRRSPLFVRLAAATALPARALDAGSGLAFLPRPPPHS